MNIKISAEARDYIMQKGGHVLITTVLWRG